MRVSRGDRVVLRTWRWDVERLKIDAETSYEQEVEDGMEDPQYSVSVFASEPVDDDMEDSDAVCHALVQLAREVRSFAWASFTTQARLERAGFELRLHEPPPGHYDVLLGHDLDDETVIRLNEVFDERERVRVR